MTPIRRRLTTIASALALPVPAIAAPSVPVLTAATVTQGRVAGTVEDGRVGRFLGIPYAKPPLGDLRWRAPQPAAPWPDVRHADSFGANCMQTPPDATPGIGNPPWTHEYDIQGPVSEDCLTLNVWTPAHRAGERLPVLFWIYGGGYTAGGTSVPIYDGVPLAEKGVIVVTVNYRVGVFGFLANAALDSESASHTSGNYGLLDQIAALRWVRANIAAFGGDPAQVTIAGQSAGASSVDHLIATPLAHGLFARAISQSGSAMGMPIPTRAAAEARGALLARIAGAQSLADLRRMPAAQVMAAVEHIPHDMLEPRFSPIIDGYVLPDAGAIDADTNDTPLLTGMTWNETTGAQPGFGAATTASVTAEIHDTFGASAPAFLSLYGVGAGADANAVREAIGRDRGRAALALWAGPRTAASRQPLYLYIWAHAEPGPEAARYRAFHASELSYVFDTLTRSPRPFTAADTGLAAMTSDYWVNFIRTGNPNGSGLPAWPAYAEARPEMLKLDVAPQVVPVLTPDVLAAYAAFHAQGGALGLFYLH